MSREAKIGMLTGMFVIVLLGVLLSEYLGNGGKAAEGTRMSALPQGEQYRRSAMQPVSVAGTPRTAEPTLALPPAYATARPRTDVAVADLPAATPSIPSLTVDTSTPVTAEPVIAVPAGPVVDSFRMPTPTIESIEFKPTAAVPVTAKLAVPASEYTIAQGDTLDKISKKYYGAATKTNKFMIISANSKLLHDESSVLVVGKKLSLPGALKTLDAPKAEVAKGTTHTVSDLPMPGPLTKKDSTIVIAPPGLKIEKSPAKTDIALKTDAKTDAKKEASATLYVVKKGDTLEKIAKTVSAKDYQETIKRIVAINKLKDANAIREGMKLTLPVIKA